MAKKQDRIILCNEKKKLIIEGTNMKKVILLFLISLAVVSVGCSNEASNEEIKEQITDASNDEFIIYVDENPASRLGKLKQAFKEAGVEVGRNERVAFSMIHAKDAMRFKVGTKEYPDYVEIYEYDMDSLSDEAKEIVKTAKEGYIEFASYNEVKFKNGLMLVFISFDGENEKDKIYEVFDNFK